MTSLLNFYQHLPEKISPSLFHIGSFELRWYSLSYLFAFMTVYLVIKYRIKTEEIYKNTSLQMAEDFIFYAVVGIILGGRLGYVLFYNLQYYISQPWEIFWPFRNGTFTGLSGMSYHGGVAGILIAYFLFAHKKKIKGFVFADLFAVAIPLGYTWGRLGNFMNGELYGRMTEVPWGMYFYENVWQAGKIQKMVFSQLRHPSQLYEAFLEGIVLFAFLWLMRTKKLAGGSMCSLYLFGYGFVRFFIEFFRQPDDQFKDETDAIGTVFSFMTMGQVLCTFMMIGGLSWLIIVNRKKVK